MLQPDEVVILKKAPPRKRPRRIAKKIAKRYGAHGIWDWRPNLMVIFCNQARKLGSAAAEILNNIAKDALYPEPLYGRSFFETEKS